MPNGAQWDRIYQHIKGLKVVWRDGCPGFYGRLPALKPGSYLQKDEQQGNTGFLRCQIMSRAGISKVLAPGFMHYTLDQGQDT